MARDLRWAYDFECKLSLQDICLVFNDNGPWQWEIRDSYINGYYLNTRPVNGARFRLHQYPQAFVKGPRGEGFSALLEIEKDGLVEKPAVNSVFLGLLDKISANDIIEIEPYD